MSVKLPTDSGRIHLEVLCFVSFLSNMTKMDGWKMLVIFDPSMLESTLRGDEHFEEMKQTTRNRTYTTKK